MNAGAVPARPPAACPPVLVRPMRGQSDPASEACDRRGAVRGAGGSPGAGRVGGRGRGTRLGWLLPLGPHRLTGSSVQALADPWVALAAVAAAATSRLRIGPMVTPVSRRRVPSWRGETVTLDLLSSGRLIFGVGLGSDMNGEFAPFGEVEDARERARLLDQGLDDLARYWAGEFRPVPVQRPRIPVWVAGEWPNRRPVRRALRWDGLFPVGVPGPDAMAELVGEIRAGAPGRRPVRRGRVPRAGRRPRPVGAGRGHLDSAPTSAASPAWPGCARSSSAGRRCDRRPV